MKRAECSTARQCVVILVLIVVCFLVLSCGPPRITPPFLELERDGVTMHLLGTIHKIPDEHLDAVLALESVLIDPLSESDALVMELGEYRDAVADGDRYRELLTPSAGRPSVREVIASWEPDRRERFLENMQAFPLMDHVGRQDALLDGRPAQGIFDLAGVLDRIARIDNRPSVEGWLFAASLEYGVPLHGLETLDSRAAVFDNFDDESAVASIESLLALDATGNEIGEAYRSDLYAAFDSWASGTLQWPEGSQFDALFPSDESAEAQRFAADWEQALTLDRETGWIDTIDRLLRARPAWNAIYVAVGAMHITPGEGEFVDLLLDAGWNIVSVSPETLEASQWTEENQTSSNTVSGY